MFSAEPDVPRVVSPIRTEASLSSLTITATFAPDLPKCRRCREQEDRQKSEVITPFRPRVFRELVRPAGRRAPPDP